MTYMCVKLLGWNCLQWQYNQDYVITLLQSYYTITKVLKDNNFFNLTFSIIDTYSYKNKNIKINKDSSKTVAKSSLSYYTITKKPNGSNFLILVFLTKSIYSYKNKYANTQNKGNKHDKIFSHIFVIKCQRF